MQKRVAALFLALCLCLTMFATGAGALAEEETVEEIYLECITTWQGSAYAYGNSQLYTYDAARDAWQAQGTSLFDLLNEQGADDISGALSIAGGEDALYLLLYRYDNQYGMVPVLVKMDANQQITLMDEIDLGLGDYSYPQVQRMVVMGSDIYLLYWNDVSSAYGINTLLRIGTADGKITKLGEYPIWDMVAYRDGKLLVRYYDQYATSEDGMDQPAIMTFDPVSQAMDLVLTMPSYNCGGVAWDAETDTIYYADSSCVYRLVSGATVAEKCGYLLPSYGHGDTSAEIVDGYYFVEDYSASTNIYVTTTDPALLPERTLKLAVSYADETIRAFSNDRKDVAVELTDMGWDVETITQGMITGSNSADVLMLYMQSGAFGILRDKGYCVDLSSSEVLMEAVSAMYPQMVKDLLKDGKLYAVPASMGVYVDYAYYPSVLEAVGLSEEDLPTTWKEMLDFIERWEKEIAPDWEDDYDLFDQTGSLYNSLFSNIFGAQVLEGEDNEDGLLHFNTTAFVDTLKRLEEIRPLLEQMSEGDDTIGGVYYYDDMGMPSSLLTTYYSALPYNSHNGDNYSAKPLLLKVSEDSDYTIGGQMSVYFVNPNSANKELATEFLEYVVQHMESRTKILLNPDANEPVETSYYASSMKYAQENLESIQRDYEEAAEEDKADLKESLDSMQRWIDYIEEDRWDVSVQDIANYREVAPYVIISTNAWASGDMTNASNAMQRYMDGNMDAEQFAKEFDRIVTMMQMENQ